jgi:signal transduction histidine kinase/DNA-binding LacI/PurR family transcriptional regulator/AraC-like DNA-binding protein
MYTTRLTPQAKSRPTIGLITALLKGPTEINLWHGVEDRSRERDVNLICFSGGIPNWPYEYESRKNILFEMAGIQNVNGLLIWSNILSHTLDKREIDLFCRKYIPLPVINMGMLLQEVASIYFDMRAGMRNLLTHLIEKHACRRIAFIRGLEVSQDAEERFQAYEDTLTDYGIPFEPDLVKPGDFRRPSAFIATEQLIDKFGTDLDAIVSANDNMAIGVIQALQKHGIRVPEDILVVGFDNIEETLAISPTLTTVRTPWYEMGSKSVDMLLAKLDGDTLPDQIELHTELILGQSCGCRMISTTQHNVLPRERKSHPKNLPITNVLNDQEVIKKLLKDIQRKISPTDAARYLQGDWAERLIDAFSLDIRNKNNRLFITTLELFLNGIISGTDIMAWHEVIASLQIHLLPTLTTSDDTLCALDLLHRAHNLIGDSAHRQQLQQRLMVEEQTDRLNRIVQTMSTIHDVDRLMALLAQELPGLGINSCFLSLYEGEGNPPQWSRLIMASDEMGLVSLAEGGELFPTRDLVPRRFIPSNKRYAFDVEALFFQEEQIGFVLLALGSRNGDVYTALRGHISSVLKSAQLVQKIKDAEARAVKADQLKTRLLANVSHELRTPLNIIIGFSQTAMSTPNPYGLDLPEQLIRDLGHIFTSGEHLIRMINDLLDTSRAEIGELDLWMEYIDVRPFLEETFSSFAIESKPKKMEINWELDIPGNLPVLYADPVRLRQILINLLSNAKKFTDTGHITMGARVQIPHLHIWVADSGEGIPVEHQERIFEPFVTADKSNRRHEGIGLGLSITRRLVALHGGSLTLDSRPGRGSVFHIYLPLPNLADQTIRVVDEVTDRPVLLYLSSQEKPGETIEALCRNNGYELIHIKAKDDLHSLILSVKPAALAWDLTQAMPADWSIIQALRNHPQICQLPFLLFSQDKNENFSGKVHITDVLLKPIKKTSLLQMITSLSPEKLSGSILIVDDDENALHHYSDLIKEGFPDFLVLPAQGGRAAIEILKTNRPDLVILDLMMPDVDGFTVLKHIRNSPETASIPVIVMSGRVLSYADVQKLNYPQVIFQTKGIFTSQEFLDEISKAIVQSDFLPQHTSSLVRNSIVFVQENYSRTISLDEIAAAIGASKSFISRIFHAELGLTLWEYLKRYRINKALALLSQTDQSITEIAARVGFDDTGYFARVFNKIMACSPREYRRKIRTGGNPVTTL